MEDKNMVKPIEVLEEEIIFEYNDTRIPIRKADAYISLTALAKATNSRINDYLTIKKTLSFLHTLSEDTGIPLTELTEVRKGGHPTLQGTWGHYLLAYHFAFWADDTFALWVVRLVDEYLKTGEVKSDTMKSASTYTVNTALPYTQDFQPFQEQVTVDIIPTPVEERTGIMSLSEYTNLYTTLLQGYKEERQLNAGMTDEDKKTFAEIRMNIADLTRKSLSSLRKQLDPTSEDLEVKLLSASLPAYNSNTLTPENKNDMVSVNQRQQELYLLGEIPRYLMPEEISSVGKKSSRTYQMKYKQYPARIKYTSLDGKDARVNAYQRQVLPEIVDPHIKSIFGILSVIEGRLPDASVI